MTPLFKSLVILAVIFSGISLWNSQRNIEKPPISKAQQETLIDNTEVEKSLREWKAELITLQARVDALEIQEKAILAKTQSKLSSTGQKNLAAEEEIDARVEKAVQAVLDEQGIDMVRKAQREAKRESTLAGFAKFTNSYGDGLPQVYQSVTDKMSLDAVRQRQLEQTLEDGWIVMDELTAQLALDLTQEEERALMGEIKSVGGETIQELGTFLNGNEMLQLGEIMIGTEGTQRMGYGIAGAGKETIAEEQNGGQ